MIVASVLCLLLISGEGGRAHSPKIATIIDRAHQDGIDLPSLPFAKAAFKSIDDISRTNATGLDFMNATRVDTHGQNFSNLLIYKPHNYTSWLTTEQCMQSQSFIMGWCRILGAGRLPLGMWPPIYSSWQTIAFLTRSCPCRHRVTSNIFFGDELLTVGLARLLNEWLAELVQAFPGRFSFFAVAPLPYVSAAITEVNYAMKDLRAKGVGLLTSHEGLYLGNPDLGPFFTSLNSTADRAPSIFVHPTAPFLRINGSFVEANPTLYATGQVEYYFDTVRTILDLTLTQSFVNFTNLRWIFSHCGGAFPSIEDRALKLQPAIELPSKAVYRSRVWYDSAGPTYFAQVKGLLAYGVPTSQLVFGSDYPYAPGTYDLGIGAIQRAKFLSPQEKEAIFSTNYEAVLDSFL